MNWHRVSAIILKTQYAFRRDVFRIFDIFWWPAFSLFVWGLFSTYMQKMSGGNINIISILLGGVILWTFFDRASKDISLAVIDELWSKNFVNLFSSPLTITEYLVAIIIVAMGKLVVSAVFMFLLASVFYAFHVSSVGWFLVPAALGLTLAGWTMSLIVNACIMRWGHTVEVFIWAVATMVQPFSCVFYPITALPGWAQYIAHALPTMYLFENMRNAMMGKGVHTGEIVISFGLSMLYFILALVFFYRSFTFAKKEGLLIKNY